MVLVESGVWLPSLRDGKIVIELEVVHIKY